MPSPTKNTLSERHPLIVPSVEPMLPILEDLELELNDFPANAPSPQAGEGRGCVLIEAAVPRAEDTQIPEKLRAMADEHLSKDGVLLLHVPGEPSEARLSAWRNALWPLAHVNTVYDVDTQGVIRVRTLHEQEKLESPGRGIGGSILVAQRREHVLLPDVTVAKFDANADGWNGRPGTPSWGHHRWMRRFVGTFAGETRAQRILDFGCGAGWCGIEAAVESGGELHAFDPSPEMVKHAARNAEAAGVSLFVGRTGFGEDPPFPKSGEAPYDLVICSGVVSFAYDVERWLDGLTRAVAPGGTLVFGDINPGSRGMRSRRVRKPLLPVREMNALPRDQALLEMQTRGFQLKRAGGYQLTWPMPQAMHFDETRLKGVLSKPLLLANRAFAGFDGKFGSPLANQFDSWVMHLER